MIKSFDWNIFVIIGFLGQIMFSMRFILQWIASEKAGQSIIPFSSGYLAWGEVFFSFYMQYIKKIQYLF